MFGQMNQMMQDESEIDSMTVSPMTPRRPIPRSFKSQKLWVIGIPNLKTTKIVMKTAVILFG